MIAPLPLTPELSALARRTVWFKNPEEALHYAAHFIAHVLTYGLHEDVAILRRYVTDDDLREALRQAPPGIFDIRSWHYWHLVLECYPPPPLPQRRFS